MFGYVKVNADELKVSDYRLYKAVYCGLCKTMRKRIGWLSTLSLSYDFVFMSVVLADATGEGFDAIPGRCGLNPFKKRPMAKENRVLDYASGAFAVLKYYKLIDDIQDSGFFKKLALLAMLPSAKIHFNRAIKNFPEYNFDIMSSDIKEHLYELRELEQGGSRSCERNADAFGKLLATVFENYLSYSRSGPAAEKLGYALGAYIYIADAVDDFEKDYKKGRYNPFIEAGFDEIPETAVTAILSQLNLKAEQALSELPTAFDDLRRISENVINLGLRQECFRLLEKNKETDEI